VIKKSFKFIGIAVASVVVVVLSSALLYRKYLQHNVAEERAITSPNGINGLESVRIGGIDQWIEVRGQNVNNPILLFIHGGPGIAFIPLAGAWQASWERYFTVVQWDQPGAGKTYASNDKGLQRRTMNLPQMEQDTLDVVNYLRSRFKREKIFVLGVCWVSSWRTNIRNSSTLTWESGRPSIWSRTRKSDIKTLCNKHDTATMNRRSKT
jgi:hypothetical protein